MQVVARESGRCAGAGAALQGGSCCWRGPGRRRERGVCHLLRLPAAAASGGGGAGATGGGGGRYGGEGVGVAFHGVFCGQGGHGGCALELCCTLLLLLLAYMSLARESHEQQRLTGATAACLPQLPPLQVLCQTSTAATPPVASPSTGRCARFACCPLPGAAAAAVAAVAQAYFRHHHSVPSPAQFRKFPGLKRELLPSQALFLSYPGVVPPWPGPVPFHLPLCHRCCCRSAWWSGSMPTPLPASPSARSLAPAPTARTPSQCGCSSSSSAAAAERYSGCVWCGSWEWHPLLYYIVFSWQGCCLATRREQE